MIDFALDASVLASPYASAFGGFVDFDPRRWWAAGGVISSLFNAWAGRHRGAPTASEVEVPADMGATSLVGGGLVAGDSLAALTVGVVGLLHSIV